MPIEGHIVIGEGERDEAPMLYIGERVIAMGIRDPYRVYSAADLAPGRSIVFAACGVTKGALREGVRFFRGGYRTHSVVMTRASNSVRFIDSVQMAEPPGPRGIRLY
mgnify:CR=1 FL=1